MILTLKNTSVNLDLPMTTFGTLAIAACIFLNFIHRKYGKNFKFQKESNKSDQDKFVCHEKTTNLGLKKMRFNLERVLYLTKETVNVTPG
jgi:hypothetical protein